MPFLASKSLLRVVTAKSTPQKAFSPKKHPKLAPKNRFLLFITFGLFPKLLAGGAAAAADSPLSLSSSSKKRDKGRW